MARRKISSSSDKSKRKDDLDPDNDQFIDKTMTAFDWAYERRRPIMLALFAVLLAAVGGIVFDRVMEGKRVEATGSLSKGLDAATAPIIPAPKDDSQIPPPEAKSDILTFETLEARATATLKQFEETVQRGDPATKTFALLGKGAAKYDLGEFDDAIKIYQEILGAKEADLAWLRQAATEGLGLSLEAGGKSDEALKQFEKLMDDTNEMVANTARYHGGRLAASKGDKEKAQKLLGQVLETYKESGKLSRFDYLFVQTRQYLLALNPEADVPDVPASGLDGIDPRLLRQLMQAQSGGGQS